MGYQALNGHHSDRQWLPSICQGLGVTAKLLTVGLPRSLNGTTTGELGGLCFNNPLLWFSWRGGGTL